MSNWGFTAPSAEDTQQHSMLNIQKWWAGRQADFPNGVTGVWSLFQPPLEERWVTLDSLQLIRVNVIIYQTSKQSLLAILHSLCELKALRWTDKRSAFHEKMDSITGRKFWMDMWSILSFISTALTYGVCLPIGKITWKVMKFVMTFKEFFSCYLCVEVYSFFYGLVFRF